MIINLIKSQQMFSLSLPEKVKGQYWLSDLDDSGDSRNLVSIEAVGDRWEVKSSKWVDVLDAGGKAVRSAALVSRTLTYLQMKGSGDRAILFADEADKSRLTFRKLVAGKPASFTVGRAADCQFCFDNKLVSGHHAKLTYTGTCWELEDTGSTNGTYVNGRRIRQQKLNAGDCIYIMGLRIVVGSSYLAVNNPDGNLKVNTPSLAEFRMPAVSGEWEEPELPEKDFFYRAPRFYRDVEHAAITIDPPPQMPKLDTVPMALMLGPSLTMGLTSASTALLTINTVLSSGGTMTQALPTMIMSVGTLVGTILWPILTKKYEAKQRAAAEKKRQDKYMAYLEQMRDKIRRCCKEQSTVLHENLVSPEECAGRITGRKQNLWERAPGHSDFLRLRLGLGDLPLDAEVKYAEKKFTMDDDNLQDAMVSLGAEPKVINNVPISICLTENKAVGIYGDDRETDKLLRSLLLQTLALHSYDEVKIMLITEDPQGWDFVRCLPHLWGEGKENRYFASNADEVKEISNRIENEILPRCTDKQKSGEMLPYYLILSTSKRLSDKCDALRTLLQQTGYCGCTVIQTAEKQKDLPKETNLVIHADGKQSEVYARSDTAGGAIRFAADDLKPGTMEAVAKVIANIELDQTDRHFALPNMMTFLEMFSVGKVDHLNSLTRWKENNPTKTLQTPVGVDTQGEPFLLDLHEKYHGPHGLVAGMTGSGKSEFIITYVLSLAVNYHPDEVAFILIDYKGGGLAGAFEDPERGIKLPHLAGTITNLDGAAVNRSLISIQSELRRRQAIFNEARKASNEGTMDIYKYQQLYRDKVVSEPVPHLFIISDEFAELKSQQPEFMEQLISAARIGRSLGVHLILATQKPSGVVDDQIWSNSKFRVCLKVQEKADSQEMIKCPDAAEIAQTGRFYLQVGFNELFALGQSAWCGAEYQPSETVAKSVDDSIQVVDNLGRVLLNAKPKKKATSGPKIKQIVSIVNYLSGLAQEENISVRPLWLPPIPARICADALEGKYSVSCGGMTLAPVVGEYDDPFNQKQGLLTVPFTTDGNCLVYGATGNGKTTFLTTMAYSLLKHHTAKELNLYIMDFGSETLKVFESAPQVGGVMVSADEEKTVNFMKMLLSEMERRRGLFSAYGGDHAGYCRASGQTVPNIVVMVNNFAGFTEQYEDLLDSFNLLARDGVKYGIYFVITASSVNDVRYKTQQNFRQMLTMQLNDTSDYPVVVGKTEGLLPARHKGRGLVALDRVYEFQTAYCTLEEDMQAFLRDFCQALRHSAQSFALAVPVLPEVVSVTLMAPECTGSGRIPVGVAKKSLETSCIGLSSRVAYPVSAQDLTDTADITRAIVLLLQDKVSTVVVEGEALPDKDGIRCTTITEQFEQFVGDLFREMVTRNNTYKDAGSEEAALEGFEERVYVVYGVKKLFDRLSDDGKDKLSVLLEKAESIYKLRFLLVDTVAQLSTFNYDAWFKRQVTGSDGLWIGDGVADQYLMKISKITGDLYAEVGSGFGYLVTRNKPVLLKLLTAEEKEK